jgi:hypothetical protein
MVETRLAPAHTYSLKALLDGPLAGTLHAAATDGVIFDRVLTPRPEWHLLKGKASKSMGYGQLGEFSSEAPLFRVTDHRDATPSMAAFEPRDRDHNQLLQQEFPAK